MRIPRFWSRRPPIATVSSGQGANTRKAYIHIGLAKTGTTSIQRQFVKQRSWLDARGFWYPKPGTRKFFAGHHCLAWSIGELPKNPKFCAGFSVEELARDIQQKPDHDIIVSSEELSLLSFNYLKIRALLALFPGREIFVIAYVREQAEFFNSYYLELLSAFEDPGTMDEFVELRMAESRYDYRIWFAIWDDLVGKNVIVRPYDRKALKTPNVIDDFYKIIGLRDPLAMFKRSDPQNISLNNLQAALIMELIARAKQRNGGNPLPAVSKQAFKKMTAPLLALPELAEGKRFWGISLPLLDRIREKYAETNAGFFTAHGIPDFIYESVSNKPPVTICSFSDLELNVRNRVDSVWNAKASSILEKS